MYLTYECFALTIIAQFHAQISIFHHIWLSILFPINIDDLTSDNLSNPEIHTEIHTGTVSKCSTVGCSYAGVSSSWLVYDNWNIMKNAKTHLQQEKEEQRGMKLGRVEKERGQEEKGRGQYLVSLNTSEGSKDIEWHFSCCRALYWTTVQPSIDVAAVCVVL